MSIFPFEIEYCTLGGGEKSIEGIHILLLLLGGDKLHRQRDIATAKEYWQDYNERKKHG